MSSMLNEELLTQVTNSNKEERGMLERIVQVYWQYSYNTYVHFLIFFVPVAPLADDVGTRGIWEVLEARIRANNRE
jgi:hypothetical protein